LRLDTKRSPDCEEFCVELVPFVAVGFGAIADRALGADPSSVAELSQTVERVLCDVLIVGCPGRQSADVPVAITAAEMNQISAVRWLVVVRQPGESRVIRPIVVIAA